MKIEYFNFCYERGISVEDANGAINISIEDNSQENINQIKSIILKIFPKIPKDQLSYYSRLMNCESSHLEQMKDSILKAINQTQDIRLLYEMLIDLIKDMGTSTMDSECETCGDYNEMIELHI